MEVRPILESTDEVNRQLEKGRYFYTDIKKEGILLYDSEEFTLSEAKDLPWSELKEIAKDYHKEWFKHANECLIDVHNILLKGNLNKCAFNYIKLPKVCIALSY